MGKNIWSSGSLHTQLRWFEEMKPSICSTTRECRDLFRRSLFIVGPFGGNDYSAPVFSFRKMDEVHDLVPHAVDSISRAVEKLIAEGAVDLVVPGLFPTGCLPVYLAIFNSDKEANNGARSGCLKSFNTLAWVHNSMLQRAILRLRERHAGVRIVYADNYTPVVQFILHPQKFGFYKQTPRACCGAAGTGSYNFNLTAKCGEPGATACADPRTHWNWDGIHLTEASYGHIAKGLLYGPYADPPILSHGSAQ